MPKTTAFSADLLKLIFNGTAIANIADNAATAPAANLVLSLHTADPGVGASQTTSEVAYTGYARVSVPRTAAALPVTGTTVNPAAAQSFPQCTAGAAGSTVATHFAIGTAATGAGRVLYVGTLSPTISIGQGVTPQLAPQTAITES